MPSGKKDAKTKHFTAYSKDGTKIETLQTLFKEVKDKLTSG